MSKKIISLILLLSLLISAGCGKSVVQEDAKPKEKKVEKQVTGERMSERFAPCSDLYYYHTDEYGMELIQEEWLEVSSTSERRTFSREDLGIPGGGNIAIGSVSNKELLVICPCQGQGIWKYELWLIPLKQQGRKENVDAAKAKKLFDSDNGITSCFKRGDIICFYDRNDDYQEYSMSENCFVPKVSGERFTNCYNFNTSPAYWSEETEGDYIVLKRKNRKGESESGVWLHKIGTKEYSELLNKEHCGMGTIVKSGNHKIFVEVFIEQGGKQKLQIYQYDTMKGRLQRILTDGDLPEVNSLKIENYDISFDSGYLYIFVSVKKGNNKIKNLLYAFQDTVSGMRLDEGFTKATDGIEYINIYGIYENQCYFEDSDQPSNNLTSYNLKTKVDTESISSVWYSLWECH